MVSARSDFAIFWRILPYANTENSGLRPRPPKTSRCGQGCDLSSSKPHGIVAAEFGARVVKESNTHSIKKQRPDGIFRQICDSLCAEMESYVFP